MAWAASHCQIGGLAPLQAVVFDRLDQVIQAKERLPQRDISNIMEAFMLYIHNSDGKREAEALKQKLHAGRPL
jgi:hypothetical protein